MAPSIKCDSFEKPLLEEVAPTGKDPMTFFVLSIDDGCTSPRMKDLIIKTVVDSFAFVEGGIIVVRNLLFRYCLDFDYALVV